MDYQFIDTSLSLARVIEDISTTESPYVGIDTERAQGYAYGDDAYLVQLRRGKGTIYLIDTENQRDLSTLSTVLEGVTWIVHAAHQDLIALQHLGMKPLSLFDTKLAAEIASCPRVGLAGLCDDLLDVMISKDFQANDWSQRPIPPAWLDYAAHDVLYLADLQQALQQRLSDLGRLTWFEEESAHIISKPIVDKPPVWWKSIPHYSKIRDSRSRAIAYQLWAAREHIAQKKNFAPHRILPNEALAWAALQQVRSFKTLNHYRHRGIIRYKKTWQKALKKAWEMSAEALPSDKPDSVAPTYSGPQLPYMRVWKTDYPTRYENLQLLTQTQHDLDNAYRIPMHLFLSQRRRQILAWLWKKPGDVGAILDKYGARTWQIDLVEPYFEQVLHTRKPLSNIEYTFPAEYDIR